MWFRHNSQNTPANAVDNKSKMKRKKVLIVKSSRSKEEMLKGKKEEEENKEIVKTEQELEVKEEDATVDVCDSANAPSQPAPDNESDRTPDKEADPPEDAVACQPIVLEESVTEEKRIEEKIGLNESEEEKKDVFVEKVSEVLSDSECEHDRKKPKTKHRKTMSMSNTIELVKNMGDEWIEAAKREFEEHSKRKESFIRKKEAKDHGSQPNLDKKKDDSNKTSECSKSLCDVRDSGGVVILLSDATVGETDVFETVEESDFSSKKHLKKKESKSLKENKSSSKTSQMMSAQKMSVKKIAKASSAGALSFIRKRRSHNSNSVPGSVNQRDSVDYATLSTALFIDSERTHTEMVEDVKALLKNRIEKDPSPADDPERVKVTDATSEASEDDGEEIFYDATNGTESTEETRGVMLPPKSVFSKLSESHRSTKASGQRSRKTLGGSLKRAGGGKRKVRRRSTVEEVIPPPLPPRVLTAPTPPKHGAHWLFGNSFKGDGKRDDDSGADVVSHLTDSSHFASDHACDKSDTSWRSGNLASKPVTRAESYRDRADRVKRTKRKTSDPNQLTSAKDYHDAEAVGGGPVLPGGPSGGSSNSSLSSKSNDSSHIENHGSQSEWSDEEEDSSLPWSAVAPPELLTTMTALARKRQDLIHELISSEASHVRWLRVLRRVFLTPLQRSGLLPSAELKNLFPNLPDVLQRHKRLALDLKNLKANAATVKTKPLAEALVTTLGEARYAGALAKFCGGQGLALDALRERRKRNKELNAFLARSEQDPLCARLRLQDLLACVWQRLTKYQLLLEGIVKTAGAEEDLDPQASEDEDFTRVSHALNLAKEVLHTVNTAIKTTENDHRLKGIQAKLEVRGAGDVDYGEEWKKFDLTKHSLVMEGTLSIRQEYNKRVNVLALLLQECLLLLHTDGERYVLRPIPQTNTSFSPVMKWNTALFRPNAAVKNGFFLVNLVNMHMYEFSATSPSEYNTWKKHLREAAKALEGKGGTIDELPPPPLPLAPPPVSVTTTVESVSNGSGTPDASSAVAEEGNKPKPVSNEDDGNQVSGALQSVVGEEEAGLPNEEGKRCSKLLAPEEISIVAPPTTMTAHIQLTPEERLRRAEEKVTLALSEATEAVKLVTGSHRNHLKASTEQLVGKESNQESDDIDIDEATMSTENLVMIAQSHVNSLTEVLIRALRVNLSDCSMSRCGIHTDYGLCDSCSQQSSKYSTLRSLKQTNGSNKSFDSSDIQDGEQKIDEDLESRQRDSRVDDAERRVDSITVENIGESSTDPVNDVESTKVSASGLGLRRTLSILERRLISCEKEREILRTRLQQADNRIHRMHQLHKDCLHSEEPIKQDACLQALTANSTDQSGGEG